MSGHRHGKLFIGRPCKERADDLLKLSRHHLKIVGAILTGHAAVRRHLYTVRILTGHAAVRGHLYTVGILTGHAAVRGHLYTVGIQPADSARRRLKQCSILFAAVRRWLVSAITSLGTRL